MSKRNETPPTPVRISRLIVAGGAKARTNTGGGNRAIEDFVFLPYNP
ncbi:hypothetical protein [Phenylobacterium sp.]